MFTAQTSTISAYVAGIIALSDNFFPFREKPAFMMPKGRIHLFKCREKMSRKIDVKMGKGRRRRNPVTSGERKWKCGYIRGKADEGWNPLPPAIVKTGSVAPFIGLHRSFLVPQAC